MYIDVQFTPCVYGVVNSERLLATFTKIFAWTLLLKVHDMGKMDINGKESFHIKIHKVHKRIISVYN